MTTKIVKRWVFFYLEILLPWLQYIKFLKFLFFSFLLSDASAIDDIFNFLFF